MDKWFRYLHMVKCGGFGLSLPHGSIRNYLRVHSGKVGETVGENGSSFPMVSIMAAMRCNLKCSFCVCGRFTEGWEKYEMTPDKMRKILELNSVKKTLMVVFTGGEPTLNKDLPELMRMTRKEKHLVGMISNGTLLNKNGLAKELGKAGLCDAQISVYDNTVNKLPGILPEASKHFAVNASYVLLNSKLCETAENNFDYFIDLIKMCKETGCSSLKFNLYQSPNDRVNDDENDTESIEKGNEVYDRFIQTCKDRLKGINFTGYNCKNGLPSPRFSVFFPTPYAGNAGKKERLCRLPWVAAVFNAGGEYSLCCRASIEPEINDIFKNGEAIINSEKARRIRKCLIDQSVPLEPDCANCVYLAGSYISDL